MLCAPLLEKPSIAQRQVLCACDSEPQSRAVDPLCRPLQLCEVSNRRLIHNAMPFAVAPFAAPLLVTKCGHQSNRPEHLRERVSVCDLGLRLHPMLMSIFP